MLAHKHLESLQVLWCHGQVIITSPPDGAAYFPHQPIPYEVFSRDPDSTITNVSLIINGERIDRFRTGEVPAIVVSNLPAGQLEFDASAADDDGGMGRATSVRVNAIDGPPVIPLQQEFNFQVDLSEQLARIDNPTPYPIDAARVLITDLPPNVEVFNATGTTSEGVPYVQYNAEIPAGGSGIVTIEYFTPFVQTIEATLTGQVAPRNPPHPALEGTLIEITRLSSFPDGRALLTFKSMIGRVYAIEYTSDMMNWKTAYPTVTAVGEGIQWTDNGWPKTEGHPADVRERFYRVRMLPVGATP